MTQIVHKNSAANSAFLMNQIIILKTQKALSHPHE